MTLQELRFLVALAQEQHFGKAASLCFVSQPTLSIAIRKLEQELGIALFERDKNDVRITQLGQDIVERAKRVLAEADGIKQAAEFDKDQLTGTFRLGVIYTAGPYLLPPLVTSLHKLAPQMPLEIQEDYTGNLRDKLNAGELDAIIVALPFTETGVVTRELYKEYFEVLMPAEHPLAKHVTVSEEDLMDCNVLMLGEGHCFREQVISACPQCFSAQRKTTGPSWHSVAGTSLETIRHMVASQMGVTILPETAAKNTAYHADILTTRPLKATHPYRIIALAWRKSFPRMKAIDVILQSMQQCKLVLRTKEEKKKK